MVQSYIMFANYSILNVTARSLEIHLFKFSHLIQNNLQTTHSPLSALSHFGQKKTASTVAV